MLEELDITLPPAYSRRDFAGLGLYKPSVAEGTMKTFNFVSGALAASLVVASSFAAFAQGGIGNVTVSGPAQIDGQNASSGGSLGAAARLSTGDGGTAVVTLAGGGELRLEGQS